MIFYKGRYGHSKRYALLLSQKTGIPAVELTSRTVMADNNPILILAAYAGGLDGGRLARKVLDQSEGQPILCICGLSDPNDPDTMEAAADYAKNCHLDCRADRLFFLRGGIDYAQLCFKHSLMMWMLYQVVKRRKDFKDNGFLETYGKQVDFFDEKWIAPVVKEILNTEHL